MEGLEVSILSVSEVLKENRKVRIDSGYFSKEAIAAESVVEGLPNYRFGEIASVFRKGIFDIKAETYVEPNEGVPFIRIGDLQSGLIQKNSTAWIDNITHRIECKTALKFGDLVLSKTAYPAASIINLEECNVSQDTIAVRLNSLGLKHFKSGFIAAFLNAHQGRVLMARRFQGNVQQHLSLEDGKAIRIPRFGTAFQCRVHDIILAADLKHDNAAAKRKKAEDTLLAALGLTDWTPPEPLSYTARASDACAAGRMDAEHFKGKFRAAEEKLVAAGASSFVELGGLVSYLTNGHTPLYHDLKIGEISFLTAEHVGDFTIDYQSKKRIMNSHHRGELARTALRFGDILMTIKGRVGNSALVEFPEVVANINQDVALLRFKDDAPPIWYILAFINSSFGKLEVEKWSTGAINPFLGLYNVRKIRIPLFDNQFMEDVGRQAMENVQSALAEHEQAQYLLDATKRAVEIAIEDGEAIAMTFLDRVEGAD